MPGGSSKQTVGYKYLLGSHLAVAHGPIDGIVEIQVDRRVAWSGLSTGGRIDVDAPFLFGGDSREGGVSGPVDLLMGWPTQNQNDYLVSQLGSDVPAFRGVVSLVLRQVYMGNNPYLKPWAFKAARTDVRGRGDEQWYIDKAAIFRSNEPSCEDDCGAFDEYVGAAVAGNLTSASAISPATDAFPVSIGDRSVTLVTANGSSFVPTDQDFMYQPCTKSPDFVFRIDSNSFTRALTDNSGNNNSLDGFGIIQGIGSESTETTSNGYGQGWFVFADKGITFENAVAFTETFTQSVRIGLEYRDLGTPQNRLHIFLTYANNTTNVDFYSSWFDVPEDGSWAAFTFSIRNDDWDITDNPGGKKSIRINTTASCCLAFFTSSGAAEPVSYSLSASSGGPSIVLNDGVANNIRDAEVGVDVNPLYFFALTGRYRCATLFEGASYPCTTLIETWREGQNAESCACNDMNPAHIIRECLTDDVWGMGYLDADIDDDAFIAAADVLSNEGMGMSILWDREQPLEDFIGEVLRHIDAVLYVSRVTGKFVLKLIRAEASSLTLDETNVSSVTDAKRPTISELTNAVSVVYWDAGTDEDAAITVHNEALRQIQGVEISTTVQYPGFSNSAIASRVAERDLKALSTPLLSCTITASRAAADLNVGDVITLDWPDLEINMDMRVNALDLGDGIDNKITIEAVQDVFTTPSAARTGQQSTGWVDPLASSPLAAVARVVTETPYYPLVVDQGQIDTDAILSDDPDAGFLLVAGGRQANEFDAAVSVDSGAGFESAAIVDFSPWATLSVSVSQTDDTFYYSASNDIDEIAPTTIAQIGEELVKVTGTGEDSNGTYLTVGRGILDTTPKEHSAGSSITVWGDYAGSDNVQYSNGESVDVRLLTRLNTTQLSTAPTDTVTFQSRAIRPYPPGNFRIDGLSYPVDYIWRGDHTLTWAHRDRKQQTDGNLYDHFTGDIGPEPGVTYRVEGYAFVGDSTIEEQFLQTDVGTLTTWGMDSNLSEVDSNMGFPPDDARTVTLKVWAQRGGYDSWQAAEITLQVPPFTDSVGEIDSVGFDSIGFDSVAGDPFFSSVSLLLPLDGADGATSTTDESNDANTVTFNGSAQIDTAQSKWGVSSAYFPSGASSCLSISESNFPAALTNDFTLEFWYRPSGSAVASDRIFQNRDGDVVPGIYLAHSSALGIQMYLSSSGASFTAGPANYTLPASNQWYHIAIAREGNNVRLFVDGVLRGTLSSSAIAVSTGYTWVFGGQTTSDRSNTGWMDDIRFTEGVARYTAGFTPPSGPFPLE